jgi:hypothetical protein
VQKTIKSYLSTADASDATKAVEALKPFAANDNEILSVLSATSCKKLVKTYDPGIWRALSLMCNASPCGEGLFLRSVAELLGATTNKSPYLSELRDMLGELCELTRAECPLLMRAVELFVSRANEHRDFVLCHGDWSGSLPATMQGTTLSADMAKALSQYRGTLSLRLDSLTDDSAEILAKSKLSTLILHGLKRISEAATHALATFPGYLKVESESLSIALHNAINAGRHFVRDGYYEPGS